MRIGTRSSLVALAVLLTFSSSIVTYAILNTVALTDIVSISDRTPLPRSTVEDTFDISEEVGNNNQQVGDSFLPNDGSDLATTLMDDFSPSDSVLAISSTYYLVSLTSAFAISDKPSSGAGVSDLVDLGDGIGDYAEAGIDAFSMIDSVARAFFITLSDSLAITDGTETEQGSDSDSDNEADNDDRVDSGRGGGGGPSNLVFDEAYFAENPLARFQVRSVQLTDSQGRGFTEVKQDEVVNMTILFRNYQKYNQSYVMLVQMENEDTGYTKGILQSSGWLERAESVTTNVSFEAKEVGMCKLTIMIWSELDHPIPLTDSISKSLRVTDRIGSR